MAVYVYYRSVRRDFGFPRHPIAYDGEMPKKGKGRTQGVLRSHDSGERYSARLGGRGRSVLRRDRRTSKRACGAWTVRRGIRHIRVSARYRRRSARYSGRRGLPDIFGRYRFQKRASDYRGLVQDRPVEYEKASRDHDTSAGRGRGLDPARFRRGLEIFLLEQSDARDDHALGGGHVSCIQCG